MLLHFNEYYFTGARAATRVGWPVMVDPIALGEDVARWLRRELERVGLAGELVPKVVNPRTQGGIAGVLEAVSAGFELDPSARYTLEARVYVSFYEGTPMGEQLGMEALSLARQLQA